MRLLAPHFESYAGQKEEQALLKEALAEEEIEYFPWNAIEGDLPVTDAVFWQGISHYHQRLKRLEELLEQVENKHILSINPCSLIRWNSRKTYLRELEEKGIKVLPTVWLESYDTERIRKWMEAENYAEIVVKPVVSAGAYRTFRLSWRDEKGWKEAERQYGEAEYNPVMAQSFATEILTEGEWSFIFFGREFSHSVRKFPREGDYRIQHVHGGSYRREVPENSLLKQAQKVMEALPGMSAYARVDGIVQEGRLALMEVELIEPYFYLDAAPEKAALFAEKIRGMADEGRRSTAVA